jgi:hydroxymethylpyrimidine pyrophosphatase-like HAD family hydrolase
MESIGSAVIGVLFVVMVVAKSRMLYLLDVDGTLLDPYGRVRESARSALTRAREAGVVIMLATGRGHGGTRPLKRELGKRPATASCTPAHALDR